MRKAGKAAARRHAQIDFQSGHDVGSGRQEIGEGERPPGRDVIDALRRPRRINCRDIRRRHVAYIDEIFNPGPREQRIVENCAAVGIGTLLEVAQNKESAIRTTPITTTPVERFSQSMIVSRP